MFNAPAPDFTKLMFPVIGMLMPPVFWLTKVTSSPEFEVIKLPDAPVAALSDVVLLLFSNRPPESRVRPTPELKVMATAAFGTMRQELIVREAVKVRAVPSFTLAVAAAVVASVDS